MYAAARAQLVQEALEPLLAAGRLVLLDRFVDSSLAYQGAGRGLGIDAVRAINAFGTGGLVPDRTLLLRIDPAAGRARSQEREAPPDRLEQQPDDFFARVAAAYDELARSEPDRIRVLDADQPPDAVLAEALAAIDDFIRSEPSSRRVAPARRPRRRRSSARAWSASLPPQLGPDLLRGRDQARRIAGPARRLDQGTSISQPVTLSTTSMTSRLDRGPVPLPRLKTESAAPGVAGVEDERGGPGRCPRRGCSRARRCRRGSGSPAVPSTVSVGVAAQGGVAQDERDQVGLGIVVLVEVRPRERRRR